MTVALEHEINRLRHARASLRDTGVNEGDLRNTVEEALDAIEDELRALREESQDIRSDLREATRLD